MKTELEENKTKFLHLAYELAQKKEHQKPGYTQKANELIKMYDDAIELGKASLGKVRTKELKDISDEETDGMKQSLMLHLAHRNTHLENANKRINALTFERNHLKDVIGIKEQNELMFVESAKKDLQEISLLKKEIEDSKKDTLRACELAKKIAKERDERKELAYEIQNKLNEKDKLLSEAIEIIEHISKMDYMKAATNMMGYEAVKLSESFLETLKQQSNVK